MHSAVEDGLATPMAKVGLFLGTNRGFRPSKYQAEERLRRRQVQGNMELRACGQRVRYATISKFVLSRHNSV